MTPKNLDVYLLLLLVIGLSGCAIDKDNTSSLEKVAANEEVANYLKAHEGRGALTDDSKPTPPEEALKGFRYPDDLALDLVLSEPEINQPVYLNFDHRGRLWVVQYKQYPYPEGLKITSIDNHLRAQFDKMPEPPPEGAKGADKITFFEDTNGDGTYDKATDAITGLNIATSVTFGRGSIWVLSPPYLLAYPDPDGNGLPDGSPEVHLEGFGLEDTHAVANSLRWGPDGWLYGAQGSTTTANISSSVSKNISFQGQAIWRYHPETEVFEIFAEGGGNNAFHVEIDKKGRIYSGSNGVDRGPYYKQGAYYIKSWGKHGPLTNPYAFGYLPNMVHKGEKIRFTHALVKYEGGSLPARYHGDMIAINPLQSYVQLSRFEPTGSSFSNIDEERIMETEDHWFRPVNVKVGPDGAVYMADWYDSRLSHVDPRDTWHKSSGRIYRLRNKDGESVGAFDLSTYSNVQLIKLLSHENKWFRQQALRQFGDRKDKSVIPHLMPLLKSGTGQTALEALWAINLSGGFNDEVALLSLNHNDPFVRMWGVRLLGDANKISGIASDKLVELASKEPHPEVRSQLASTAKRLPGEDAIPIIKALLKNHDDSGDPDIPMLIWWAMEAKAESDREGVLGIFEDNDLWKQPTVQEIVLKRIMQRYTMAGGQENFAACTRLLDMAPSAEQGRILVTGLQEGLRGQDIAALPADLLQALKPYQKEFGEGPLALSLRQGKKEAVDEALVIIADQQASLGERLSYIRIMGEINEPRSVPVLLKIVESNASSGALKQAALQSLQRYDDPEIGVRVAKAYPGSIRADEDVRAAALALFASRTDWAHQLIDGIDLKKQVALEKEEAENTNVARTNLINKEDVPEQIVRQLKLLGDPAIDKAVERLWPEVRLASSAEKSQRITKVSSLLKSGTGDPSAGRPIFSARCGSCHRLFDSGGNIGPELTGYDRRNVNNLLFNTVDPNADIREGYVNYHITTTDGRTLAGTITARSSETITLQPLGGEAVMLSTDQIENMKAQPNSMMPERLLDGLTDQQIRDIFAYLTQDNK
jgi:putative heme-binding domain-containing protein